MVELDSNQNDVLRQKIDVEEGEYLFKLQYAPRSGYIASSQMSVFWNGIKVKSVKAQDFLIHTLQLSLKAFSGTNLLEIAGEGKSDGVGMTIANLKLVKSKQSIKVQGGHSFLKNGNFK